MSRWRLIDSPAAPLALLGVIVAVSITTSYGWITYATGLIINLAVNALNLALLVRAFRRLLRIRREEREWKRQRDLWLGGWRDGRQ